VPEGDERREVAMPQDSWWKKSWRGMEGEEIN
jgi:hypothetical protein